MTDMEEPTKPASSYWIWLSENREALTKEAGGGGAKVAKLGGERWKTITAAQKAPFEKKAADAKAAYAKAMEEFQAGGGVAGKRRLDKKEAKKAKTDKKAKKEARKDPNRPKKPPSSYWLWLGENRAALVKEAGGGSVTQVSKIAGQKWNTLPAAQKAPFEKKAEANKATYTKAMEEYKKNLPAAGDAEEDGDDEEEEEEEGEEEQEEEPPAKKQRGGQVAKAAASPVAKNVAAPPAGKAAAPKESVMEEVKKLGFDRQYKTMMSNPKLAALEGQNVLEALRKAEGGMVAAKKALLGA